MLGLVTGGLLVGDVVGLLADRGVGEPVDGTQRSSGEPLGELLAAVFDPPVLEDELVVPQPQVRVVGVDEQVELTGMGRLELLDGHLPGHDPGRVLSQTGDYLGIPSRDHLVESRVLPVVADVGEQPTPGHDLIDELVELDGHPLVRAPLAVAFEHLADPIGIGVGLDARLTLRAELAVRRRRVER